MFQFSLKLQRKAQYSVINVIAPIVLLSLMDLLVFWLPPESGEKVSLGITVLLSFSVFLLVVDERMPRTSDTVPLLSEFMFFVVLECHQIHSCKQSCITKEKISFLES